MSDKPWRRDPDELTRQLAAWAQARIGEAAVVTGVSMPDNGFSSETVLFAVEDGGSTARYAARLAPAPESYYPVFPDYDLDAQRRCMDLVRTNTDVPAPVVHWYEDDVSWLGSPFLVMERIDGIAPSDLPPYVMAGWLKEMPREEQQRLAQNAIHALAGVHQITADRYDLTFLTHPELGGSGSPMQQQLGYQRWYYDWAREGVSYPLIERTLDWLEAHRPPEDVTVLNWGDSRIGNILWQGTEPVAVLDWEMATVGPPEVDLAWMVFLNAFFEDLAVRYEIPGLDRFMLREDVVAAYERNSDHRVHDMDWFELFAAVRMAIVTVRTSVREIAYGRSEKPDDPDDVITFRSLLESMLEAVDAP